MTTRRTGLPLVAVVAAAVAVVSVGLAASPLRPATAAAADTPLAGAQHVLDARVEAVATGDKAAWMATVDPQASAAFKDMQSNQFDGLRQLPLQTYKLTARLDDTGDLGSAAAGRYPGATAVFLPETRQTMRFRDYDDRDDVEALWLTFVQRANTWRVASDTDAADLALDTARFLWDLGPLSVQRTDHFLVVSHPAQASRAMALAALGEQAMTTLSTRWDRPWSHRLPLILPGSIPELGQLLDSTLDLSKFVALVTYGAVRDTGYEVSAPRLYVQDTNLSRHDQAFQTETLVHELDHAAASNLAGPFVPVWVHEGLADWVAGGDSTTERRPRGSDGRLPRDAEFGAGSQASIILNYNEARSAMSALAAAKGRGAPSALFAEIGSHRVEPGNEDYVINRALERVAGQSLAAFEAYWARR
ncbi:MAG: hypothetical protein QOG03_165 [Actinomycetota bacterium]|jgi:hypothetical protein|nr:hypothetical protein [Actinomycetota bacterium]